MGAVRQAASGLIYGVVSLLLVIGSLSLALAQAGGPSEALPTYTPLPSSTSTPRPSPVPAQSTTSTNTASLVESSTPPAASPTGASPTAATATRVTSTAATTATAAAATLTRKPACRAPYGWAKTYVVQPGDTLFRIATRYGVSVDALQSANCRSNTLIFIGEQLWVPYVLPIATELTIIPTFPTPTEPATETASPSETPVTPDP